MQTHFTTQRLQLHPMALQDADFILELTNTREWIEFIGNRNLSTTADAEKYIQKILDNPDVQYWVARLQNSMVPIGAITLIKRGYLEHKDIGFAFLPKYAKQGFAIEAATAVLAAVAESHPVVAAITVKENTNSILLLEKMGFSFEQEIEDEGEVLSQYIASADALKIASITRQFFGAFTNSGGNKPQLEAIYSVCLPEAIIIKKQGAGHEAYNLDTFVTPRKTILTDGTLQEFEERETAHTSTIVGNIAQRHSTYAKAGILNNVPFKQQGNKFFQYIKTGRDWKISSVAWEDESE
jgi:RimJ/RimL family protein N-acetyltransferase